MPSFECTSKLRAADRDTVLNLNSKHYLTHKDSDNSFPAKKSRFPENVAIVPASTIVFSLSAVLNRKRILSEVLIKSQLAQHFVDFLQANADQLGLGFMSKLYIGEGADPFPSINVRTNRNRIPFHDSVPVRVTLRSIHMQYSVTTTKETDNTLFSSRLSLPYMSLLDNILKRFLTHHLVKKYPLVFGALCQQLDIEALYFSHIFRSIHEMAQRSQNPAFRAKFKQLTQVLQKQQQTAYTSSSTALAAYLDDADAEDAGPPKLNSETAFCLSLEKLFCNGVKRPMFKTTPVLPMTNTDTHDDEELSRDYSAESSHTNDAEPAEFVGYDEGDQTSSIPDRNYDEAFDLFRQGFLDRDWAADDSLATSPTPAVSTTYSNMIFDSDAIDSAYDGSKAIVDADDEMVCVSSDSELPRPHRSPEALTNEHCGHLECHTSIFSDSEAGNAPSASRAFFAYRSVSDVEMDSNMDQDLDIVLDMDYYLDVLPHAAPQAVPRLHHILEYEIDISKHSSSDVLDIDSDVDAGPLCPLHYSGHVLDIGSGRGLCASQKGVDHLLSDDDMKGMDICAANASSSSVSFAPLAHFTASHPESGSDRFKEPPSLDFGSDNSDHEEQEHILISFPLIHEAIQNHAIDPEVLGDDIISDNDENDRPCSEKQNCVSFMTLSSSQSSSQTTQSSLASSAPYTLLSSPSGTSSSSALPVSPISFYLSQNEHRNGNCNHNDNVKESRCSRTPHGPDSAIKFLNYHKAHTTITFKDSGNVASNAFLDADMLMNAMDVKFDFDLEPDADADALPLHPQLHNSSGLNTTIFQGNKYRAEDNGTIGKSDWELDFAEDVLDLDE
ncbi:hypothetical protein C8R41DRAFT_904774 [Lentinula lateritia]|uniref:Uncharacterized protein n=1 Tax=Lentinula lateritia TaxID=40482 RepID=A0ABQ8V6S2_9AGAR|nr:hypothetical protein C8R41DRAFT_904774 [Lentinula lateritia]